jgi:hypothetical protein
MAIVKSGNDEYEILLTTFNERLQNDTHAYGITSEELSQLQSLVNEYKTKQLEKRNKALEAQAATTAFNELKRQAVPLVSKLRQRMNLHPEMTDEGRQLYNLSQRGGARTALSVPEVALLINLNGAAPGRVIISIGPNPTNARRNRKPKGALAILVQCHEGGAPTNDSEWQHLAQVTNLPVIHEPGSITGTFAYRACYIDRKGNRGPWSEKVKGTIAG